MYNFGTLSTSTIDIGYYEIFKEMIQLVARSRVFSTDRPKCPNHKKQWVITVLRYNRLVSNELLGAGGTLDPSLSGNGGTKPVSRCLDRRRRECSSRGFRKIPTVA